jgi:hypothetical protein
VNKWKPIFKVRKVQQHQKKENNSAERNGKRRKSQLKKRTNKKVKITIKAFFYHGLCAVLFNRL